MDKKLRNLLILVGVLVLLCVGYAVAGLVFPEESEEGTEAETSAETVTLFSVTEDGLTALSFTYDKGGDGTAELWEYTRHLESQQWQWAADAEIPLSSSVFYSYSSTLATMSAVSAITGVTEAQLAEYGLDKPVKTVTFTDKVGGPQSFCIGVYNTYNGTYYLYKNGDTSTVYLVSGEFYSEFEAPVEAFVSYDDLPEFDPEDIVSLTMTQGDRTVVLTRVISAETAELVWMRSVNGMPQVQVASDLGSSLDLLVGDMDYLTCYAVTPDAYPQYGLDQDTTRMTVVYNKTVAGADIEKTFTLTLGGTDKYGYYYANPDGTTLTMLLGGSVFSKVMTYDDDKLSVGDNPVTETVTETDTTAP